MRRRMWPGCKRSSVSSRPSASTACSSTVTRTSSTPRTTPRWRKSRRRARSVAERIGFPVTMSREAPLPFEVAAALHFQYQAHFHPGRYLAGLAEAFVRRGGVVVEGVWGRDVDEDGGMCHVETTAGGMSAGYVVVATRSCMTHADRECCTGADGGRDDTTTGNADRS
ncbi:FAD-dependent oxidoreductase [Blastococcus goldschmidtiae]|uniref:FAD-dependent oxidoreductase n=1 Tax=Blastococcus goldschmidtiae TaxID=3075546 RepID=A0ABU2K5X4_9ACTN|nr:FAD-dependent oxidoreductase [Blastococcus sp. DSM 46792]MDT0275604.1 FAD-dependent oxidoreductase [Blastococcus sp. DSM 46792]